MNKLTVSDHAVLRYLERVGGFDIEGLRRQIADRLKSAADAGARGVVLDGHSFLIDRNSEGGSVVVTVLPVTRNPRNLIGGHW